MMERYNRLSPGMRDNPKLHGAPTQSSIEGARRELELLEGGGIVGPRTYELNYRAKPEQMLDWDKPLAQQPQHLDTLYRLMPHMREAPKATGESFYDAMEKRLRGDTGTAHQGQVRASQSLGEAGIPGIRYRDEGSRNWEQRLERARHMAETVGGPGYDTVLRKMEATTPTHNYVMFDPSKIDIMAKYGLPFAAGAGGLGAVADQSQYEGAQ
jgi:hypothetical protein